MVPDVSTNGAINENTNRLYPCLVYAYEVPVELVFTTILDVGNVISALGEANVKKAAPFSPVGPVPMGPVIPVVPVIPIGPVGPINGPTFVNELIDAVSIPS